MNVKTSIVFLLVLGVSIPLLAENNAHAEIPMEIQILKWQGDEYWDQIQDINKKIAATNSTEVIELYELDLGIAQANLDHIIQQMNATGVPTIEEQMTDRFETAGSCSSCTKTLKFKGAYEFLLYGIFPWTNYDKSWTYAPVMGKTVYSLMDTDSGHDKIEPYYYFSATQGPMSAKVQLDYLAESHGHSDLDDNENTYKFKIWSSMSPFKLPMNQLGTVLEDTHLQFGVKPLKVS